MKVVVIGGTGLIGSKTVEKLRALGHEALAAAPSAGVNITTGEGLAEALAGAEVVVDVSNSPTFEEGVAMAFFQAAGRNIVAAEKAAGVRHHLALSVVGAERLQAMGYFRAKLAQEEMIKASPIPWTLLRSTQFFPFIGPIIETGAAGGEVRLPSALCQPVAPDHVAATLAELAAGPPLNAMVEVAGPRADGMDRFAAAYLKAKGDPRRVAGSPAAPYFDLRIDDRSLMPGPNARLGGQTFEAWLQASVPAARTPSAARTGS